MVYVPPPPLLVVRSHDPSRRWRAGAAIGAAWIASLLLAAVIALMLNGHIADAGNRREADRLNAENASLQQRIAVLDRSEQVSRAATVDLQQTLRDRQEQISALRADIGFYSRLTGSGARREGLAVQRVRLGPARGHGVYNFVVTVTQNLKAGQLASGRVRVNVTGVQAGKLVVLNWSDLASDEDREGLAFSFKYFQQLKGTLMLPSGFTPNRIRAEADAGGDMGRAEQDFAWADALVTPEIADVQQ